MSESSSSSSSGGIGFTGLLGILFIGLKLGGIIDWSWWYVTMPLWIPFAIIAVVLIFIVIGITFKIAFVETSNAIKKKKKK